MIWECVSDMRSAFTESNNKKPLETAREEDENEVKKKGEGEGKAVLVGRLKAKTCK